MCVLACVCVNWLIWLQNTEFEKFCNDRRAGEDWQGGSAQEAQSLWTMEMDARSPLWSQRPVRLQNAQLLVPEFKAEDPAVWCPSRRKPTQLKEETKRGKWREKPVPTSVLLFHLGLQTMGWCPPTVGPVLPTQFTDLYTLMGIPEICSSDYLGAPQPRPVGPKINLFKFTCFQTDTLMYLLKPHLTFI